MISYTEHKDQWYEHYDSPPLDGRYEMFLNLLEQDVSDDELIKDDVGNISVDLKSELISEKQYEKAVNLIEKTKESTTKFYKKEFPYLSNFAVEYYLFKQDFAKMQDHLHIFIENPDHGYDLFLPLFDKIHFYQRDELALNLANHLHEPIIESDELIGGAEKELIDIILYHIFQECYQSLEQKQDPYSLQQLKDTVKKFEFDETMIEKDLPEVYRALADLATGHESNLTYDNWTKAVRENATSAARSLYLSFAVYMLKRGNFHFSLSASIAFPFFDMLLNRKSLLNFNFKYKDVDELIAQFFGFLSNKEAKGFAVLWGIPHIYDFLYNMELISKDTYDNALKHVTAVKGTLLEKRKDELWLYDFVHTWVKPLSMDEASWVEEKNLFHESFTSPKRISASPSETPSPRYGQLPLFDDLLPKEKSNQQTKAKPSTAKKKKSRKQAKKQRKKNQKK